MENSTRSNNSKLVLTTREFLIPSWPKILLYMLISSFFLTLYNAKALWESFHNSVLIQNNLGLNDVSTQHAGRLEKLFDELWTGRLAQVLFWAFTGCIVYVCIWFVVNLFTNIRNDIVADEYVHPTNYNRRNYWETVFGRKLFLVAVVITLIGAIGVALKLLSLLAALFFSALQDFRLSPSIVEVLSSILATTAVIYVVILLVHITVNAWRAVYADL